MSASIKAPLGASNASTASAASAISGFGPIQPGDIRILVVESVHDMALRLVDWLQMDDRLKVVKVATSAAVVNDIIRKAFPDVVLVGHRPPGLDGFAITRDIMEQCPVPVVMYTSFAQQANAVAKSIEAGAVACIENPLELNASGSTSFAAPGSGVDLRDTVRLMSEIRVVRRRSRVPPPRKAAAAADGVTTRKIRLPVVGIGASTGGPLVLQAVLSALPAEFPLPILVVQHIAKGFLGSMTEWLRRSSKLPIHIAAHGVIPQPGNVYLAPDDFHMGFGVGGRIVLSKNPSENGVRPSVDYLFRTLAELEEGGAIGVLMTGMGKDGAAALKRMHDNGCWTLVQDAATSVVHGMPGEAIALGAADEILPAGKIAESLVRLAGQGGFI